MNKRKVIGLVSMFTGFAIAGVLIFSVTGHDFMTNLFGFYGVNPPSNKAELCKFVQDRLADPTLKNPQFIHRYQTDYDTQCKEALRPSAPEITHDQLGYFLHNATSGIQTFAGSNNYIEYLLNLYWASHTVTANATTTRTGSLDSTALQATNDPNSPAPVSTTKPPKVRVHPVQQLSI